MISRALMAAWLLPALTSAQFDVLDLVDPLIGTVDGGTTPSPTTEASPH